MSLKEYLDQYWPTSAVLHELLGSLKEAILEEDLMSQSPDSVVSKKAGTGYQEVERFRLSTMLETEPIVDPIANVN